MHRPSAWRNACAALALVALGAGLAAHAAELLAQIISFDSIADHTYGDGPFAASVSGGASGNPVTLSSATPAVCAVAGTTVTILAAGTCTLTAEQAGNAQFAAAAPVSRSFAVRKANQTITFTSTPPQPGYVGDVYIVTAQASSGLPIVFTADPDYYLHPPKHWCTSSPLTDHSAEVFFAYVGGCNIFADQPGNANYNAAPTVMQSVGIGARIPGMTVTPPLSLAFERQTLGTISNAVPVTIANAYPANVDFTVSGISTSAGYHVSHNCGLVVVGARCTAWISFVPDTEGAVAGSLAIDYAFGGLPGSQQYIVRLSGTGERSLVSHFYQGILGRNPDAQGRSYWDSEATRLHDLGADANEAWFMMGSYLFNSREYAARGRNDSDFVDDLYETFFNRDADAAGLSYWLGRLSQGVPRDAVLSSFMLAPEFRALTSRLFGDASARPEVSMVTDLYRGILDRLPESSAFEYWVAQLREAQCQGAGAVQGTLDALSYAFFFGPEYANRSRTNAQFVSDEYLSLLHRGADPDGLDFWSNQLEAGRMGRDAQRRLFLASPEFAGRVEAIVGAGCMR